MPHKLHESSAARDKAQAETRRQPRVDDIIVGMRAPLEGAGLVRLLATYETRDDAEVVRAALLRRAGALTNLVRRRGYWVLTALVSDRYTHVLDWLNDFQETEFVSYKISLGSPAIVQKFLLFARLESIQPSGPWVAWLAQHERTLLARFEGMGRRSDRKPGRPRKYHLDRAASPAEKQKAYRDRKRALRKGSEMCMLHAKSVEGEKRENSAFPHQTDDALRKPLKTYAYCIGLSLSSLERESASLRSALLFSSTNENQIVKQRTDL